MGCRKKKESGPQKEKPPKPETINFFRLFKYTNCCDKLILAMGFLFACIAGLLSPLVAVVMGKVLGIYDPRATEEEIKAGMLELMQFIGIIASILWVTGYVQYAFLQHLAEKISYDLRGRYLTALMTQETTFFEEQQIEALPSQIAEYFQALSEGVGEKVAQLVYAGSMFVGGIAVAFYSGPYYALMCMAYLPIMVVGFMLVGGRAKYAQNTKLNQVQKLGAMTEETLSALKLVISFAQEDLTLETYDKIAEETRQKGLMAAKLQGSMSGMFVCLMFGFFAYSYGIASFLVQYQVINPTTGEPYTLETIVAVSQSTIMANMTCVSILPIFPGVVKALIVGKKIFDVIEREPKIKSKENSKTDIEVSTGINFNDVRFRYATQPENSHDIFTKVNFMVKAGTSTAIVGPSGSGKSTIVQMINRFYDPAEGSINFDKTDLRDMNLKSLREQIGYVSQEPVLILGTIRENMLYGNRDASVKDIEEALHLANASFVLTQMEKGLDTYVGAASVMNLSGGQKQRIAIARALIKKPKILIFDEATSALDPKSEAEVQSAIESIEEKQGGKLTIIMIAHRLQTIQTAKNLLYLENPTSVLAAERGTPEYDELIERLRQTSYAHQKEESEENAEDEDEANSARETPNNEDEALERLMTLHTTNKKSKQVDYVDSDSVTKQDDVVIEAKHDVVAKPAPTKGMADKPSVGWKRIMSYYFPKWMAIFMLFTAAINAMSFPILGIILSKLQFVMISFGLNDTYTSDRNFWLGCFIALAFGIGFFNGIEKIMFGMTGENMTYNVRKELMRGIMFKQLCWFDDESRAPGVLTNVLSEDISSLNGMTTETLSTLIEAGLGLSLGLLLAMFLSWQQALFTLAASPILLVGVFAMSKLQWKKQEHKGGKKQVDVYAKANALLSDVILNYRTVISFGEKNVHGVIEKFESLLEAPKMQKVRNAHLAGFFFGYSQCSRILFIGIVFWIGSEVISRFGYSPEQVYISIWVLFSASMGVGSSLSNVPSVSKAKASSSKIFAIVDEESSLDVRKQSNTKGTLITEVKRGQIDFKGVNFKYPSRNAQVLDSFDMNIPATYKVALVGHSGCGKSTITNLLLRFYDIQSGSINIDGVDIKDYNVKNLRRQIGYVMQEPILFNQTIKDNILYGQLNATDEQVYKSAEQANALSFIESNFEDLGKEEKSQRIKNDLKDRVAELSKTYPEIIKLVVGERSDDQLDLILQVLTKADDRALKLLNTHVGRLTQQLDIDAAKVGKGLKWDDLLLRIEWHFEVDEILDGKWTESEKSALEAVSQNLKYCFNKATIGRWKESLQLIDRPLDEHFEHLNEFITNDFGELQKDRLVRTDELYEARVNSLRGKDGKLQLHEGFNKECGLKGSKLSGGQKQRIAIARALIKDPKILVLDEATSALDEQSQEIVQQALDRAMEGRTAIVIAHRLSTIRNCQLLLVLNKGKIVEQGTFEDLSNQSDSYFNKLKSGMEM